MLALWLHGEGTLTRDFEQRSLPSRVFLLWFLLWRDFIILVFLLHVNVFNALANLLFNFPFVMIIVCCFRLALRPRFGHVLVVTIMNYIGMAALSRGLLLSPRGPDWRLGLLSIGVLIPVENRIIVKRHIATTIVKGIRLPKREANR